jgi:hypothetical protein
MQHHAVLQRRLAQRLQQTARRRGVVDDRTMPLCPRCST